MSTPKISNKRVRDIQRAVHLLGGLLLAAYLYTPLRELPALLAVLQFVVVPVIMASGVAMWQGPRLRRRLARGRATAVAARPSAT